jgi:signal peptidase I
LYQYTSIANAKQDGAMSQRVRPPAGNAEGAGTRQERDTTAQATPRRGGFAREIVETLILTAIVFLVVHACAQPYKVDGPSMQPGLYTNDYVLISPILYAFGGSPQRGDVVVFDPPSGPDKGTAFIKRVIGIPGDHVTITLRTVYVNGKPLNEPYVFQQGANVPEDNVLDQCVNLRDVTLGPGQYLVLGDNRGNSLDSRCFGVVARNEIIGKAIAQVLPLNQRHWLNTYSKVFASLWVRLLP